MIGDNIMLAVGAKDTFEDNLDLRLYYDRKFKDYGYLGLYTDKCIRAIGKIQKIVIVEKKFREWQFNISVTQDEQNRIFEAMKRAENYGSSEYNFGDVPEKFFFVDKFYPTAYEKESAGSLRRCKKFNLCQALKIKTLPENTEDIAKYLNGKSWGNGNNY